MDELEAKLIYEFLNESWGLFNEFLSERGFDEGFAEEVLSILEGIEGKE